MSIQPLSNNTPPAYSPVASSRPQAEPAPSKETDSQPSRTPRAEETKSAHRVDQKDALRQATQRANTAIEGLRSDLKFTVDEETGLNVVKFIDVKTKEVIRQIPAQEMLEIAKRLDELRGLLIKDRA